MPTDVTLQITGSYDGATGAVQVDLAASTTSPLPAGDYRLHIVLTEGGIYYEAANGIDWHEYTMRDMVNDHEGLPVSFAGDLPQNAAASVSFSLDPLFIPENCEIVCFLQNVNNREVWQSAKVMVSDLASDATGIAASESPFRLGAAYPNPFNPETRIPVSLRESGQVRLEILDVGGRLLRVLHEGELPAGRREFTWDGRDGAGVSLGSGVYLSRLSLGTETRSRRLVLIK